jgi:hypothetical protein
MAAQVTWISGWAVRRSLDQVVGFWVGSLRYEAFADTRSLRGERGVAGPAIHDNEVRYGLYIVVGGREEGSNVSWGDVGFYYPITVPPYNFYALIYYRPMQHTMPPVT